jgi:hypothetical protein
MAALIRLVSLNMGLHLCCLESLTLLQIWYSLGFGSQCSTSPRVFSMYRIYIFPMEDESLSCLRLTQGVTPMSTTRLYRGYVNWG